MKGRLESDKNDRVLKVSRSKRKSPKRKKKWRRGPRKTFQMNRIDWKKKKGEIMAE